MLHPNAPHAESGDDAVAERQRCKQELRDVARARRRRLENPDELSRQIFARLAALPEYARAATVMFYVDFRSEVRTREQCTRAWNDGKRVIVPYCAEDRLELFRLDGSDDLAPGTMGILEPKVELRGIDDRKVALAEVDLIIVPGLAFDPQCARIGYGGGYYDRLMADARPDTALIAVAFQCQIFPEVPSLPYDVRVDKVITESAIYERTLPRCE